MIPEILAGEVGGGATIGEVPLGILVEKIPVNEVSSIHLHKVPLNPLFVGWEGVPHSILSGLFIELASHFGWCIPQWWTACFFSGGALATTTVGASVGNSTPRMSGIMYRTM